MKDDDLRALQDQHSSIHARRRRTGVPALILSGLLALLIGTPMACAPAGDGPDLSQQSAPASAEQLVEQGRALWATRRPQGLLAARDLFQRAIDLDGDLAAAWSGLADASALLGLYSVEPAAAVMPQALRAADRALSLDPDNAATHASRGLALYLHDWDFPSAEQAFSRALEIDPEQVNGHHWFGMMLSVLGRHDEALSHMHAASELAPGSALLATKIGTLQLTAGQLDEARATLQNARDRFPSSALPVRELGYVELANERPALAADHFLEALRIATPRPEGNAAGMAYLWDEGDPKLMVALALSLRRSNQPISYGAVGAGGTGRNPPHGLDADELDQAIRQRAERKPLSPVTSARLEVAAGAPSEALRWLEEGMRTRDPGMVYLRTKPSFEELASNTQFLELCRRIGI